MIFSRVSRFAIASAVALPLTLGAIGAHADTDDPVVARVNGKDIHLSVVQDRFDGLKAAQPQMASVPLAVVYDQVLEGVVDAQVLSDAGMKAGLDKDPEVQKDLANILKQLVGNAYVAKVVNQKVTDADIKKRYDELKANFKAEKEVHARHILVETEQLAKDLIARLKKGEDFAKLAAENTIDPSGKQTGGDLGFFQKDRMVPEFAEAAFAMKKGAISEKPVKTDFGWHVIKVEEIRDSEFPSMDQVKAQIKGMLSQRVIEQELADLKSAAKVEIFDMQGKPVPAKAAADEAEPAPKK